MARNPLESDPAYEHRIRERAYHLWEADGRPHGRDLEFWERAREMIGIEDSAGAGLLPNPLTQPETYAKAGIEEAEIQENLGEIPGALRDQGDVAPTPAPVKRQVRKAAASSTAGAPRSKSPAPATKPAPPRTKKP